MQGTVIGGNNGVLTGNAVVTDVLSGKTFSNALGVDKTGTIVDRTGDTASSSSSVSGTTLKLVATIGYRDGTNDTVTITDANFITGNIKSGITIFGLEGDL